MESKLKDAGPGAWLLFMLSIGAIGAADWLVHWWAWEDGVRVILPGAPSLSVLQVGALLLVVHMVISQPAQAEELNKKIRNQPMSLSIAQALGRVAGRAVLTGLAIWLAS
jgi:hypothetical protein